MGKCLGSLTANTMEAELCWRLFVIFSWFDVLDLEANQSIDKRQQRIEKIEESDRAISS